MFRILKIRDLFDSTKHQELLQFTTTHLIITQTDIKKWTEPLKNEALNMLTTVMENLEQSWNFVVCNETVTVTFWWIIFNVI